MKLKVKKLYPDAHIPTRAHPGDSGLDLRAHLHGIPLTLYPEQTVKIGTGIAVELPPAQTLEDFSGADVTFIKCGYEAQVRGRSSLATKGIIACGGIGTVDNGYRGEIGVALTNTGNREFTVNHGDRIAQLVVVPVVYPDVEEVTELSETPRGDKGFGSTGA